MPPLAPSIPRTRGEHAAQDARIAGVVLDHPAACGFPNDATDLLAHIADGDHGLADADVHRLVLAAMAVVLDAEVCAAREAGR
jgi:hypothetical protein